MGLTEAQHINFSKEMLDDFADQVRPIIRKILLKENEHLEFTDLIPGEVIKAGLISLLAEIIDFQVDFASSLMNKKIQRKNLFREAIAALTTIKKGKIWCTPIQIQNK